MTPNTPIIAPTVVYQNSIPQRRRQSASGKKYGRRINPASPTRNPTPLPIAIRVINDGFQNMSNSCSLPDERPTWVTYWCSKLYHSNRRTGSATGQFRTLEDDDEAALCDRNRFSISRSTFVQVRNRSSNIGIVNELESTVASSLSSLTIRCIFRIRSK